MSDTQTFDARNFAMQAQKKLLSKMASKKIVKAFIDDTAGRLLDNMYRICKEHTGQRKTAEKLIRDLIKTVIKVGILHRNDKFTAEQLEIADQFKKKFRMVVMTVISFYEVEFTFDKAFLSKSVTECKDLIKSLVSPHLTEKSLGRIDNVFDFFANPDFLDKSFRTEPSYREILGHMVKDLNIMLDEGTL